MDDKNTAQNNLGEAVDSSAQSASNHQHSSHRSYSQHASHHSSSHHSSRHSSHRSSHHSSSESSSSHHSKHKHKSKGVKTESYGKWRSFFSFMLFLSLSATFVFAGLRITVLNQNSIADIFLNSEYIQALYNDVSEYSEDMCMKCGVPKECVDQVITYNSINEVQNSYTLGAFEMDEMYTDTTYIENINTLKKDLISNINSVVKSNKLSVEASLKTKGAEKMAEDITSYIRNKVEFRYVSDIQGIINVGVPVVNVGIGFFAIISLAFLLLTASFADKKYRGLRSVCYSIFSVSALNLLLVIMVGIVSIFKNLLIYPLYLCDSLMRYIGLCVSTFLIEALFLFIVGVMISAVGWKFKRDNI